MNSEVTTRRGENVPYAEVARPRRVASPSQSEKRGAANTSERYQNNVMAKQYVTRYNIMQAQESEPGSAGGRTKCA